MSTQEDRRALTTDEIKEHKKMPLYNKANTLNNIAFILSDVVNSAIMDAEELFGKIGLALKQDDKMRFKQMSRTAHALRIQSKHIAEAIYKIEDADAACEDSDEFYELIKTVVAHCSDDREKVTKLIAMIKVQFPIKKSVFDI